LLYLKYLQRKKTSGTFAEMGKELHMVNYSVHCIPETGILKGLDPHPNPMSVGVFRLLETLLRPSESYMCSVSSLWSGEVVESSLSLRPLQFPYSFSQRRRQCTNNPLPHMML